MRRGVLLGSIVAVLLVSATAALVVPRIGTAPDDSRNKQNVAIAPGGGPAPAAVPALQNPGARPVTPVPPSFDVVKVGPTGTAVIAGRAEPGSRVTVRDGDKVIGEVTADRRGEWALVPDQPIRPGDRLLSLEALTRRAARRSSPTRRWRCRSARPHRAARARRRWRCVLPRDGAGAARVLQRPEARRRGSGRSRQAESPCRWTPRNMTRQGRVVAIWPGQAGRHGSDLYRQPSWLRRRPPTRRVHGRLRSARSTRLRACRAAPRPAGARRPRRPTRCLAARAGGRRIAERRVRFMPCGPATASGKSPARHTASATAI